MRPEPILEDCEAPGQSIRSHISNAHDLVPTWRNATQSRSSRREIRLSLKWFLRSEHQLITPGGSMGKKKAVGAQTVCETDSSVLEAALRAQQRQQIDEEIQWAIGQRHAQMKQLQDRLLNRFAEYEKDSSLRHAIYRIYSREEKQAGSVLYPHLKAPTKIAEEVFLNRFGGEKTRGLKVTIIKAKQNFSIFDVEDYLGITIVCPFPSDVEAVVARIRADGKTAAFRVNEEKIHSRPEYAATHLIIGIEEDAFDMLCCEVQIKTAFQDAFSWKTHDLTYKPQAGTDGWLIKQFEKINAVIRAADDMSDDLRARIQRESAHGHERRVQAKRALKGRLKLSVDLEEDSARRTALQAIFDHLERCASGEEIITPELRNLIDALIKDQGYNEVTIRIAALYMIDCGRSNQTFWLEDHLAKATNGLDLANISELSKFLNMHAGVIIGLYCIGDLKAALRLGENALRANRGCRSIPAAKLASNVAYFFAELYGLDPKPDHARKAAEYYEQAVKLWPEGDMPAPPTKDTLGYVKIQTGESVEDVEAGLDLCRRAFEELQGSSEGNVSAEFFELHREIAYQRLAELSRAN